MYALAHRYISRSVLHGPNPKSKDTGVGVGVGVGVSWLDTFTSGSALQSKDK